LLLCSSFELSFSELDELDELFDAEELLSSLSEKAYLVFQPIRSSSRLFADQKLLRAFGLRSFGLGTGVAGLRRGREGVFEFAMIFCKVKIRCSVLGWLMSL